MGKAGEARVPEGECILRLKRWFIMGAEPTVEAGCRDDHRRTGHLKYGGYRMLELASDCTYAPLHGESEEVLDHMCRGIT